MASLPTLNPGLPSNSSPLIKPTSPYTPYNVHTHSRPLHSLHSYDFSNGDNDNLNIYHSRPIQDDYYTKSNPTISTDYQMSDYQMTRNLIGDGGHDQDIDLSRVSLMVTQMKSSSPTSASPLDQTSHMSSMPFEPPSKRMRVESLTIDTDVHPFSHTSGGTPIHKSTTDTPLHSSLDKKHSLDSASHSNSKYNSKYPLFLSPTLPNLLDSVSKKDVLDFKGDVELSDSHIDFSSPTRPLPSADDLLSNLTPSTAVALFMTYQDDIDGLLNGISLPSPADMTSDIYPPYSSVSKSGKPKTSKSKTSKSSKSGSHQHNLGKSGDLKGDLSALTPPKENLSPSNAAKSHSPHVTGKKSKTYPPPSYPPPHSYMYPHPSYPVPHASHPASRYGSSSSLYGQPPVYGQSHPSQMYYQQPNFSHMRQYMLKHQYMAGLGNMGTPGAYGSYNSTGYNSNSMYGMYNSGYPAYNSPYSPYPNPNAAAAAVANIPAAGVAPESIHSSTGDAMHSTGTDASSTPLPSSGVDSYYSSLYSPPPVPAPVESSLPEVSVGVSTSPISSPSSQTPLVSDPHSASDPNPNPASAVSPLPHSSNPSHNGPSSSTHTSVSNPTPAEPVEVVQVSQQSVEQSSPHHVQSSPLRVEQLSPDITDKPANSSSTSPPPFPSSSVSTDPSSAYLHPAVLVPSVPVPSPSCHLVRNDPSSSSITSEPDASEHVGEDRCVKGHPDSNDSNDVTGKTTSQTHVEATTLCEVVTNPDDVTSIPPVEAVEVVKATVDIAVQDPSQISSTSVDPTKMPLTVDSTKMTDLSDPLPGTLLPSAHVSYPQMSPYAMQYPVQHPYYMTSHMSHVSSSHMSPYYSQPIAPSYSHQMYMKPSSKHYSKSQPQFPQPSYSGPPPYTPPPYPQSYPPQYSASYPRQMPR